MTEAQLKNKIIAKLKELCKNGTPIWWLKLHGGPMQQAGVPDLVVILNGTTCWLELKRPAGKVSKLQQAMMNKIDDAGGMTRVFDNIEDFMEWIRFRT